MAVKETQVIQALRPVEDPELHRSIVELNMVRGVRIHRGAVTVTVALTVAGCPMRTEITQRVTQAVSGLRGVKNVEVELVVMTPQELDALRRKMQDGSGADAHRGHGHEGHGHEGKGHEGKGHEHGPAARTVPFAQAGSRTRVLGITSGKGGVGKSSVAVNLAVALARQGYEVAILDADVYGFSVPRMLGITEDPQVVDDLLVPPVAHGVRCISMGFFAEEDKPVMWRGPMLHKALEQFLVDVAWGDLDYLLVDMPPGTGDVALSMAQYLPAAEIYVVTTPQPAAQRVAQRSAAMARQINLPLAGIIENMSWFTGNDGTRYELFGQGGGRALAEQLGVPLLAQLPLVAELREGGDIGRPVVAFDPGSEVAFAFEQLARSIEKAGPRRVYREELRVR